MSASELASLWVTAVASVVLAGFGLVQVVREERREKRAESAARARASLTAYTLLRGLRKWLGPSSDENHSFDAWLRDSRDDGTFETVISKMTRLARDLVDAAAAADSRTLRACQRAMVSLMEGVASLRDVAAASGSGSEGVWEWVDARKDALRNLRRCQAILSDEVVEPYIQNEELILGRIRKEESFENTIHELAMHVASQLDDTDAPPPTVPSPEERPRDPRDAGLGVVGRLVAMYQLVKDQLLKRIFRRQ